jgi:hypothetical protein
MLTKRLLQLMVCRLQLSLLKELPFLMSNCGTMTPLEQFTAKYAPFDLDVRLSVFIGRQRLYA